MNYPYFIISLLYLSKITYLDDRDTPQQIQEMKAISPKLLSFG